MTYSPTIIDLSRSSSPDAIEALSFEILREQYVARFKAQWAAARALDPTLPDYDVEMLETDPAMISGQAWSYLRLLDRSRVNDAVRAVLAPTARGSNLEAVVARTNIKRLVVEPATPLKVAVMESDDSLLRRYLLGFDRPAAGSADAYLFHAFTAWPGMHDAAVIGRRIHGRRGDVDLAIIGPKGRAPTANEILIVRDVVNADDKKPEATNVTVLGATRRTYSVNLTIEISHGPDPIIVEQEAAARVLAVTTERTMIGAEVPLELVVGAAYGPNVLRVVADPSLVSIAPNPYTVPVCEAISIETEVRS